MIPLLKMAKMDLCSVLCVLVIVLGALRQQQWPCQCCLRGRDQ